MYQMLSLNITNSSFTHYMKRAIYVERKNASESLIATVILQIRKQSQKYYSHAGVGLKTLPCDG